MSTVAALTLALFLPVATNAQMPKNFDPRKHETKKLDIVGDLDGEPGNEIISYMGNPEKPGIGGKYDKMILRPGEKFNHVTVYRALTFSDEIPVGQYEHFSINGKHYYAQKITELAWQGPYVEHMCFSDLDDDGQKEVLLPYAHDQDGKHTDGKVLIRTPEGYRLLNLRVVPDKQ